MKPQTLDYVSFENVSLDYPISKHYPCWIQNSDPNWILYFLRNLDVATIWASNELSIYWMNLDQESS